MNDLDFKQWFYLAYRDTCVCVPAKCGGTSFYRHAFNVPARVPAEHVRSFAVSVAQDTGAGPFSPHEIVRFFPDSRRLIAVRHPVERFQSLWRDKCRRLPGPTLNSTEYLRGWTQEQLMDLIESTPFGDPHWVPQQHELVPEAALLDCAALGAVLGYSTAVHENRTRALSTDPDPPVERILQHYRADADIYWRVLTS